MSEEFYLQRHISGYLGNAPVWWCKDGKGYSAYIENAERFSRVEAEHIAGAPVGVKGDKYTVWPCDFIDDRLFTVFDMQYFHEYEQYKIKQESAEI